MGAWTFAFDRMAADRIRSAVGELEELGFGAVWVPEGSTSRDVLAHMSLLLSSTKRISIASGIANITARPPEVLATGGRTLGDAYEGRAVVGIGVGHEYSTQARGVDWANPLQRMRSYLDRMDATPWGWEPQVEPPRLLAALGDRMLELSAARALGAHSYFVPVAHTAHAREVLGPRPVLAVELTAVLEPDPAIALERAGAWAGRYLELPNYARNLRRFGFDDRELSGSGSPRLLQATVAMGDEARIAERVQEHLSAGADHVCVQLLVAEGADVAEDYRAIAPVVLGSSRART